MFQERIAADVISRCAPTPLNLEQLGVLIMPSKLLSALLAMGLFLALEGPTAYAQDMDDSNQSNSWLAYPDSVGLEDFRFAYPLIDSTYPGWPYMPPDAPSICTDWVEMHPTYGAEHHQNEPWFDNGDSVISVCDYVNLGDSYTWHVEYHGVNFELKCIAFPGSTLWVRPPKSAPGGGLHTIASSDPTCQIWHEIYPTYCSGLHIEGWLDNGDGIIDLCDDLLIGGQSWHIENATWGFELSNLEGVPSTGRAGTFALVALLALASAILIIRARKRAVQPANQAL